MKTIVPCFGSICIVVVLLLAVPTTAQSEDKVAALTELTAHETQRIEATQAAAKKTPEMKAATKKFHAARKAYQLDRAKFPADRDRDIAIKYRQATKEYEQATRQALLAQDPALGPLLDRQAALARRRGAINEGETVADSDVGQNPAIRAIKDVPGLPRVLLIGDSISIGYTLQVREQLKGVANLHRIPVNGGATEVGLEKLKDWLGDGRWGVIHFNFGLHDAKYASETTQRASREQYEQNLRQLVAQLKPTGAKLIFATTTPVPNDGVLSPTRKFDSIPARNEIAVKVMQENGVAIDDLYAAVLPEQAKVGRPNDVHYGQEGYELLAKAVAASIVAQLPPKASKTGLDTVGLIALKLKRTATAAK